LLLDRGGLLVTEFAHCLEQRRGQL
jgi:hypothetical protein